MPEFETDGEAGNVITFALLLGQSRQLVQGSEHVRSGAWARTTLPLNRKVSGGRVFLRLCDCPAHIAPVFLADAPGSDIGAIYRETGCHFA